MDSIKKSKLPVYRTTINTNLSDETGIDKVAFVLEPAIESGAVFLHSEQVSETKSYVFSSEDSPFQQMIFAPILIPDKLIYRREDSGYEYNIYFSSEDIFNIKKKFMASNKAFATNFQHKIPFAGAQLVEVWQKTDLKNDKSIALGLDASLPVNTLFLGYYIENKDTFLAMKSGQIPVTGLSLEGLFSDVLVKAEAQKPEMEGSEISIELRSPDIHPNCRCEIVDGEFITQEDVCERCLKAQRRYNSRKKKNSNITIKQTNKMKKENQNIFARISAFLKQISLMDYTTQDGKILTIDEQTMIATIDGQPAPDGDITLEDGSIATIQGGLLINITDVAPIEEATIEPAPVENAPVPAVKAEVNEELTNQIAELNAKIATLSTENQALIAENEILKSEKEKLSKVASVTGNILTPETVVDYSKLSTHERITLFAKKNANLI
tara:strand:- start:2217 stop:3533 length:1317 start_codon:yes stop_codon:yes gene_type:complete